MTMPPTIVKGLLRAPSSTNCPISKTFYSYLFHSRLRDYFISKFGGKSAGIYNNRNVRGSSTTLSLHAEGRAVDISLGLQAGRKAFEHAVAIACSSGIQEVIFNRRIWTSSKGERAYNGVNPHTDYVHIGLNKCGAEHF